jgi:hypothetical protein
MIYSVSTNIYYISLDVNKLEKIYFFLCFELFNSAGMGRKFSFGIYPGGTVGTDSAELLTVGAPDDLVEIQQALNAIQDESCNFWVRCYRTYSGAGKSIHHNPAEPERLVQSRRKLDLVIGYQSQLRDFEAYEHFVRKQVRDFGSSLSKIQITEEPNLQGIPVVDGDVPGVKVALIRGVIAAKEEVRKLRLSTLVGFNAVCNFDPEADFWRDLATLADPRFYEYLDYVGLDFFPDVFYPIPEYQLEQQIKAALQCFRENNLKEAGISWDVPIHITENGWPTSAERTPERQSAVLEKIIRTVYGEKDKFNIQGYELFSLRDSDSSDPNIFNQFGLMTDSYSPKPAFDTFRKLVQELSR